MITKQDIEDYSEVSKQPSRYSEEFRQKQQSEKQLRDYLRNFDIAYKQQSKINYKPLIEPWLASYFKQNETNT